MDSMYVLFMYNILYILYIVYSSIYIIYKINYKMYVYIFVYCIKLLINL